MTVTDPFVPSARVRLMLFALLLCGFGVTAWSGGVVAPSPRAYPPLFALIVERLPPLAWLSGNVAMLVGIYVEWRRVYRSLRSQPAPGWLVLATSIAVGVPAVTAMLQGEMAVLLLYAVILGFAFALCGNDRLEWTAAGLVLAIPAAIELPMVVAGAAVVLAFLAREPRTRGFTLAASFAVGLVLWLYAIPAVVVGSASPIPLEPRAIALFAAGAAGLLFLARRLASSLEVTVLFGVACVAVAGFGGFTLALPFLGATPLLLLDRGRPRAAQWLAVAGMAGVLIVQSI